jgi:hypothetical protein
VARGGTRHRSPPHRPRRHPRGPPPLLFLWRISLTAAVVEKGRRARDLASTARNYLIYDAIILPRIVENSSQINVRDDLYFCGGSTFLNKRRGPRCIWTITR